LNSHSNEHVSDKLKLWLLDRGCKQCLQIFQFQMTLGEVYGFELTFHKARHNFGTHITLSMGIPIETVGKMMGLPYYLVQGKALYKESDIQKVLDDAYKRCREEQRWVCGMRVSEPSLLRLSYAPCFPAL